MDRLEWRLSRHASLVFGALLVVAGVLILVAQYVHVDLGQYGWPLFVIVPGLALLLIGVLVRGTSGLVVPGAVVTATGLVLAVQNAFNLWATWAYAWSLIFPGAAGVGLALQGRVRGSARQVEAGLQGAVLGLALFVVLGAFFEGVAHVSGLYLGGVGQVVVAVLLIVVGVVLVATRVRPRGALRPAKEPTPPPEPPVGSGSGSGAA